MTENLFSYGTLQNEAVQLSTFNRKLEGYPDAITGYKLSHIEIKDQDVIATSGETHHRILIYTGNEKDIIHGTVFRITETVLINADEYETSDYKRVSVPLLSGGVSWVYVSAE